MENYNPILRIGVIGPRSFGLGGHDIHNDIRSSVRKKMIKFIKEREAAGFKILGITGLDIGTEQDFALACRQANIDYTCYVPYTEIDNLWESIPNAKVLYDELYEAAVSRIILHEGDYSPKKVLSKCRRIIRDSDTIIYVRNPLKKNPCSLLELAQSLDKHVYMIEPYGVT